MGPLISQLFSKITDTTIVRLEILKFSWDVDMYSKTHSGCQALSFQPNRTGAQRGTFCAHTGLQDR